MSMMIEEVRVAEIAVGLLRVRINEHMARCTYCEYGPTAYAQASSAILKAFDDMDATFLRIKRDIKKREGGL